jgi:uncharacterized protein
MELAPKQDRLLSIDALRGFAVLGILMMNVQVFAMVFAAYENPLAHMDLTGDNLIVWAISHTFFHMKFITIFSGLFGAGIVLMVGESTSTALHYRRMSWLLVIGMIHAYVFWYGDILVSYALFGMLAVMARNWSIRKLVIWGIGLLIITGLMVTGMYAAMNLMPGGIDPIKMGMALSPEDLAAAVETYQAGFLNRMPDNAVIALTSQIGTLIMFGGRLIGVMFIGMALFKSGFLSASWSSARYLVVAMVALVVGLSLSGWSTQHAIDTNFAFETAWEATGADYVGSLFVALGYSSSVMLICKSGLFGWVVHIFAATGRMAFTNYLTQTLIMTFIFVGAPGLGLFGTMERIDQAKLVMLVWALQLVWSPLWLSVFRFGPLEWLWRSLSYWKLQPLSKRPAPEATG